MRAEPSGDRKPSICITIACLYNLGFRSPLGSARTCYKRLGTRLDLSLIYVLEVFSFPFSMYSLWPSSIWTNRARSSHIIHLSDPRSLRILSSLTCIRCYPHCFQNQSPSFSSLTSIMIMSVREKYTSVADDLDCNLGDWN